MALKRATGKSKFAIQSSSPEDSLSPIGSLPTVSEIRPEVPNVSTQGNSYFSRESIGSAKFDSRMDFSLSKNSGIQLQSSKGSQANRLSLSPERPTAIASIDLLSSTYGNPKSTEAAIIETLEVADFESKLLQEDYNYIVDSLENNESTKSSYSSLKDSATASFSKINSSVDAIQKVSAASEAFSEKLDIRLSWNNVQAKISEYYNTFTIRFGSDTAQSSLDFLKIDQKRDTSTSIVNKLENLVNNRVSVKVNVEALPEEIAYEAILKRIEENDLLFDDGEIISYSKLSKMKKVAVCCEVISKILNDTFAGASNNLVVKLPTYYSGSKCNVFEPFNIIKDNKKTNSHYEIIRKTVSTLSTKTIEDFKNSFVASYNESYEKAKTTTALGYPNEVCTPLDIFTRILKKTSQSFQTVSDAKTSNLISNQAEIYDSVILSYAMKSEESSKQFNGFIRGIILTNILDKDFLLGYDSSEEYDTITETKAEIDDSSEGSKTVTSKVGTKTLQTKTLEAGSDLYNSIFSNIERVNNFPQSSRKYVSSTLKKMDECVVNNSYPWYAPLYHNFTPYSEGNEDSAKRTYADTVSDNKVDSWIKNSPKAINLVLSDYVPSGTTSILEEPLGGVPTLLNGLVESLQNFSRDDTGKTIANAIIDTYDELIATFEEATGKSFSEVSSNGKFIVGSKTCSKRAIIDALIECYGNVTINFFRPGFYNEAFNYGQSDINR